MDKLSAMKTFATVVEAGSFTRAADILALPKARVSQRVSDLERYLGVRLLQRTTRALNLTEDGKAYFARCQVVLQEIDELEGALKNSAVKPSGLLRVEALVSVARWVLAPHLHELKATYPELAIRLGSNDRLSHLLEDGIDVAIRGGMLEDSSQIARHVCDVQFGLYAAPSYLEAQGKAKHPSELHQHRLLSWFGGQLNPFAWCLETDSESFELAATNGMQFDDPDVAMTSCIAGAGICPGAPFAVEQSVRQGNLVPVLPHWSFPARPIHIVYPSKKHLSARVRCFVDWSVTLMRDNESLRMTPAALARSIDLAYLMER